MPLSVDNLTKVALLGTERQALDAAPDDAPLSALQAGLLGGRREPALLGAAALAFTYERAGQLPRRDDRPLVPPAEVETLAYCGERAGSLLLRMLGGEFAGLLPEWIALASRNAKLALPEALPLLLGTGNSESDLREAIASVLGHRGRWLAAQNEDWQWVAGAADDGTVWETGQGSARLMFLRRMRQTNASRAREMVVATWKQETPDDRSAFVAALGVGLGPEDEAFLESALDDKRKEVRRAAATLLSRLPGSAYAHRMTERVQPLLSHAPATPRSLLKGKKAKPATIDVRLPEQCDKAMMRDGVEPKPPTGLGEKAWWLIQMLEAVPLEIWEREFKLSPSEVIAASLAAEWKAEFFEAWTRAAIRQCAAAWADALLDPALEARRFDKLEGLLAALPPGQREARVESIIKDDSKDTRDVQGTLVLQCEHAWSAAFSRAVLRWLRVLTTRPIADWQLRNKLGTIATRLAPEVLAEVPNGWKTDSEPWAFWEKGAEELFSVAQFRADMHAAFASNT